MCIPPLWEASQADYFTLCWGCTLCNSKPLLMSMYSFACVCPCLCVALSLSAYYVSYDCVCMHADVCFPVRESAGERERLDSRVKLLLIGQPFGSHGRVKSGSFFRHQYPWFGDVLPITISKILDSNFCL